MYQFWLKLNMRTRFNLFNKFDPDFFRGFNTFLMKSNIQLIIFDRSYNKNCMSQPKYLGVKLHFIIY